jgi:hypothetical protein
MRKPNFQASADVEKCCEYLRAHRAQDLILYSSISAEIGRDIDGRDRHILVSARRILERENVVFVVETGRGIRLATDSQVAVLSTDAPIIKTKRIARVARKRQRAVNVQNLSASEREAFYIGRAVLGAIEQATRKAFRNKLEGASNTSDGPLPIDQTLEMFRKLRPRANRVQQ